MPYYTHIMTAHSLTAVHTELDNADAFSPNLVHSAQELDSSHLRASVAVMGVEERAADAPAAASTEKNH